LLTAPKDRRNCNFAELFECFELAAVGRSPFNERVPLSILDYCQRSIMASGFDNTCSVLIAGHPCSSAYVGVRIAEERDVAWG